MQLLLCYKSLHHSGARRPDRVRVRMRVQRSPRQFGNGQGHHSHSRCRRGACASLSRDVSEEQDAEVRRQRAEKDPETITPAQFKAHLRRRYGV
jgi:hypothetical protein